MGLAGLEPGSRVEDGTAIARVRGQGLAGPLGTAVQPVVVGIARHEVDRQLAADDQLLQQRIDALPRGPAAQALEGDGQGADLAEVEVGGELGGRVGSRLVPSPVHSDRSRSDTNRCSRLMASRDPPG